MRARLPGLVLLALSACGGRTPAAATAGSLSDLPVQWYALSASLVDGTRVVALDGHGHAWAGTQLASQSTLSLQDLGPADPAKVQAVKDAFAALGGPDATCPHHDVLERSGPTPTSPMPAPWPVCLDGSGAPVPPYAAARSAMVALAP